MIDIQQVGTKVRLSFETGLYSEDHKVLYFYWETNNEMFAEILRNQLRKQLSTRIETIRTQEYNRGWSDKSKHVRKCQYFFTSMKLS